MGLSISDLTAILRCPSGDQGELSLSENKLRCLTCGKEFAINNDIVVMLEDTK